MFSKIASSAHWPLIKCDLGPVGLIQVWKLHWMRFSKEQRRSRIPHVMGRP